MLHLFEFNEQSRKAAKVSLTDYLARSTRRENCTDFHTRGQQSIQSAAADSVVIDDLI